MTGTQTHTVQRHVSDSEIRAFQRANAGTITCSAPVVGGYVVTVRVAR